MGTARGASDSAPPDSLGLACFLFWVSFISLSLPASPCSLAANFGHGSCSRPALLFVSLSGVLLCRSLFFHIKNVISLSLSLYVHIMYSVIVLPVPFIPCSPHSTLLHACARFYRGKLRGPGLGSPGAIAHWPRIVAGVRP